MILRLWLAVLRLPRHHGSIRYHACDVREAVGSRVKTIMSIIHGQTVLRTPSGLSMLDGRRLSDVKGAAEMKVGWHFMGHLRVYDAV